MPFCKMFTHPRVLRSAGWVDIFYFFRVTEEYLPVFLMCFIFRIERNEKMKNDIDKKMDKRDFDRELDKALSGRMTEKDMIAFLKKYPHVPRSAFPDFRN